MAEAILNTLRSLLGQSTKVEEARAVDVAQHDLSDMHDFSIDEYRPMKVVVIGAGFAGILAGIRFRQHIPNLEMTVYEKNAGVGGVWYANRYPGLRCDVPSHGFAYSFEHKNDWSSCYSTGPEILTYLNHVVKKWALGPHIKLQHELVNAEWDDLSGKWHLRIRRPSSESQTGYEEIEDIADVVFYGTGLLSRWSWPDIAGLHDFKGTLVHSADWNLGGATWEEDVRDWKNKKVAVIGLGSSALQIVTAMQPRVEKLYNVARGKTWVVPPFALMVYSKLLGREVSFSDLSLTIDEKKVLEDPDTLLQWRCLLESEMNSNHAVTYLDSELQKFFRSWSTEYMRRTLEKKPGLADKLIPDFPVSVRRVAPAPGYLEALCADNCDFINDRIKRVTPTGIEFEDGKFIDLDVIICATGFNTSFAELPFNIVGRNNVGLKDKWSPYPRTYLSLCTDGFPNMFFAGGPNSAIGTAGLVIMIEHQTQYAVMAAMKLQRERLKTIEPKPEAIADFDAVIEDYFKRTVFSEPIATWYKAGKAEGRVSAVWPGSNLHCIRALRHPRWEDFNYERIDKTGNRLFWLGDGMTYNEKMKTGDRTWYLNADYVDIPPIPQNSWGLSRDHSVVGQ